MQAKKILFTDLDGTLLSDDMTISQKNRQAIEKAIDRGNYVVATTGRPLASGKTAIRELGLTMQGCYMIAFNGSVLYDCSADKILYDKKVPIAYVRRLFESAHEAGLHIHTYDDTHVLAREHTKELEYYTTKTGMPYKILPDLTDILCMEPYKVLLVNLESRQILEDFQNNNLVWTEGKLNCFFSSSTYLEYCPKGVSKGSAIRYMSDFLKIPMENTIAAGDEWNDISMIKAAHIGVAVKNAVEAAKEAADYITERDNGHDAIAEVIEKFME